MAFARSLLAVSLLLGLAGCSDEKPPQPAPALMGRAMVAAAPGVVGGAKLAYRHQVSLQMAEANIQPRFDRARDLCLQNAELHCILQSATLNVGDPHGLQRTNASLVVRLPHESVEIFYAHLLAPVPGEATAAMVTSRSTQAEDLTKAITDIGQRLKQLTDYRERLLVLAKVPDAKVDDLVKIAGELSNVQSNIEAITAEKAALDERVANEVVDVNLHTDPGTVGMFTPVAKVWMQAGQVFGDSASRTLRFLIFALPWLPLAAIGYGLLIFGVRRMRR
jgi:hypothetical protein